MAKFTSHYVELGFYVNGQYRQFSGGAYVTDVAEEIAVLDRISDCVRVEEKPEEVAPKVRKPSAK